jgi:hypothetical protein
VVLVVLGVAEAVAEKQQTLLVVVLVVLVQY